MNKSSSQIEDSIYRLFEITPIPIILSNTDGKFEYVNPALCKMLGYEREAIYAEDVIITHLDDISVNQSIRKNLQADPFTPIKIEKRYKHFLGHTVYAQLNIVAQCDSYGVIKRYISQLIDLSAIKKSDAAEILLNHLVNNSNDAIYVVDPQFGRILNCNQLAHRRLGYEKEELLQLKVANIHPDIEHNNQWKIHSEGIQKAGSLLIESSHMRKDGTSFPVEANITHIKYNGAGYLLAIVRDISRRKKKELEVLERLNLDPLTNLPNRRILDKRLAEIFIKAEQRKTLIAFMYIDLDNFKEINDNYGHVIGDGVLIQTANRLKNCVRKSDIVTRLGGDEFLVVLCNLEKKSLVELMAYKVEKEFKSPYKIQDQLLTVEASIGVSVYFDNHSDAQGLIQLADEAMYQAKKKKGTSIYYI